MEFYRRVNKTNIRVATDEHAIANTSRFRHQRVQIAGCETTRAVAIAGARSADASRPDATLAHETLLKISNFAAQANKSGRRCQ